MATLISSWREVWVIGDFTFYFVQLAPLRRYGGENSASCGGAAQHRTDQDDQVEPVRK